MKRYLFLMVSLFSLNIMSFSQTPEVEKLFDDAANKFLNQNWKGAAEQLEKVLKLDPGNIQALNLLVKSYLRWSEVLKSKGEFSDALEKVNRAKELQPDNEEVLKMEEAIKKAIKIKEKRKKEVLLRKKRQEELRKKEEAARRKILEEQKKWIEKLRKEREKREKEIEMEMERMKKKEELLREELLIVRKEMRNVGLRWLIVYIITVFIIIFSFSKISAKTSRDVSSSIGSFFKEGEEKISDLMKETKKTEPLKKDFEILQQSCEEILNAVRSKPVIPPQEEALIKQMDSIIELMKQMQKPEKTEKFLLQTPMERDIVTDINPEIRQRAKSVEALERTIKDPKMAVRILSPFLKDPDNRVRANACKALYKYDPEGTLAVIKEMAYNESRWMRMSAAWVCGEIATPEVCSILESLIEDSDQKVRARTIKSAIAVHKILKERMPATLRLKIKQYEG